jgi:DNA-binding NtrC family response regulator
MDMKKTALNKTYVILITDRNRHVRQFLKREFEIEGYRVLIAKDCEEVRSFLYTPEQIDLIILDPDLLNVLHVSFLKEICDRLPPIPLIIHGFFDDEPLVVPEECPQAVVVEKRGQSIDTLKQKVRQILHNELNPYQYSL